MCIVKKLSTSELGRVNSFNNLIEAENALNNLKKREKNEFISYENGKFVIYKNKDIKTGKANINFNFISPEKDVGSSIDKELDFSSQNISIIQKQVSKDLFSYNNDDDIVKRWRNLMSFQKQAFAQNKDDVLKLTAKLTKNQLNIPNEKADLLVELNHYLNNETRLHVLDYTLYKVKIPSLRQRVLNEFSNTIWNSKDLENQIKLSRILVDNKEYNKLYNFLSSQDISAENMAEIITDKNFPVKQFMKNIDDQKASNILIWLAQSGNPGIEDVIYQTLDEYDNFLFKDRKQPFKNLKESYYWENLSYEIKGKINNLIN